MTDFLQPQSGSANANNANTNTNTNEINPDDAAALLPWAEACARRAHHAYLLLDSAHAEDSYRHLQAMRVSYASLFEGTPEEALLEIAPLLIELTGLNRQSREILVRWASQLGFNMSCLSWYASPLPLNSLAEHLRKFHRVGLSEGQTMLLRWYDTRILPQWMACLTPQQHDQFCAPMVSLQCVDGTMRVRTFFQDREVVDFSPVPEPGLGKSLVQLDDRQLAQLMEPSQVHIILNRLELRIAPEMSRLPRQHLVEFLQEHVSRLCAAGIDDSGQQLQCILLALYTSGAAWQHPAFVALMKKPPTKFDEFAAAIQALPNEIYDTDIPLWDAYEAARDKEK